MLDEYQDLIEELLGTPGIVREAGSLEPERLRLVAALHARDAVALDRIQRLVRETAPHFKVLPSFDAAVEAATLPENTAAMMESFETTRGDLVSLLMNLTLKDWERTATYDAGGEISLVDDVELHVEFDEAFRARFQG
ncbi:MAG: hypothetical protein AB7V46_02100 [Thermomicrobiales bacterium]